VKAGKAPASPPILSGRYEVDAHEVGQERIDRPGLFEVLGELDKVGPAGSASI
jgi:hypothetical protein